MAAATRGPIEVLARCVVLMEEDVLSLRVSALWVCLARACVDVFCDRRTGLRWRQ